VLVLCYRHGSLCAKTASNDPLPSSYEAAFDLGQNERKSGHANRAAEYFLQAAALAPKPEQQASSLLFASGLQIRLFQYRAALQSADSALRVALECHNFVIAGAASNNRATIYSQLGDYRLAADAAKQAVALLERSGRQDYLALALLNSGDIQSELGSFREAIPPFTEAIAIIRQAKLDDEEALAEDHLGLTLVEAEDYQGAAKAYEEAKRLRTIHRDTDGLSVTKQHLARLAYLQGQYRSALELLSEAQRSGGSSFSSIPAFWSQQLRGDILVALNRRPEALVSYRHAVQSADVWRLHALPGDITSTQTTATLHRVYREFVDLAAELSLEHHDDALAREALTVLVGSRAANLREQMLASLYRDMQLPPRYFQLLSDLETEEASFTLGTKSTRTQNLSDSLQKTRNELADLENKIGIGQKNSPYLEKSLTQNLLTSIQHGFSQDQLLLSFSLGEKKSFVWGVTRNRLELYELASEATISTHASAFFTAVQKSAARSEGAALSKDLFQPLSSVLTAKKEWIIAGDSVLLDRVPFAALPSIGNHDVATALVAAHSLRFLPSEQLLLDRKPARPTGKSRFVGVADPVYNRADSRIARGFKLLPVSHVNSTVTLARLAGSANEIRSAAKFSGMDDMQLLTGTSATQAKLRAALAAPPTVLHFAVHVVSPETGGIPGSAAAGEAALALSLTPDGVPELLTKEAISQLRVPGALVVLSGCASQQGQTVPSAGLVGLGRAWLLAGAAAVIVSSWPTPDDSGDFFSNFYTHLRRKGTQAGTLVQHASAALQETQIDMQRSAGYRSSPSFWAAYSIISEE
jgi:CHAT domain-containing protein/predicted negative regulator of RcsB-dependent stress response